MKHCGLITELFNVTQSGRYIGIQACVVKGATGRVSHCATLKLLSVQGLNLISITVFVSSEVMGIRVKSCSDLAMFHEIYGLFLYKMWLPKSEYTRCL